MENLLKAKLLGGGKAVGTMFQLGSLAAVECLGVAGLDFFVIDTEHAPIGIESTRAFIMASELYKLTSLVRIRCIAKEAILSALDMGAGGLIVPFIETVGQVHEVIRHAKFPGAGNRGFCFTRTSAFGYEPYAREPAGYFRRCNEQTLIIPQCETRGCLENIEEIVSIPEVDGIFIGPYDLSTALGHPADFTHPEVIGAIQRVLGVCKQAGKFAFMLSASVEQSKSYFEDGFSGVIFNLDIDMLIRAYKDVVDALR